MMIEKDETTGPDTVDHPALSLPAFDRLRAHEDGGYAAAAMLRWPNRGSFAGGMGQFIDRFSAARVLREVRARLAIVDEVEAALATDPPAPARHALQNVLKHLAQSYTTNPYYRDEWTPGGMPSSPGGDNPSSDNPSSDNPSSDNPAGV